MPGKPSTLEAQQLHGAHLEGESLLQISIRTGFTRSVILRMWEGAGLLQRGRAAAQVAKNRLITRAERMAQLSAAHAAVRGRKATISERESRARSRELTLKPLTVSEAKVFAVIEPYGVIAREVACGIYNIDFVIDGSIAVECFGGNWHASGRSAARQGERVEYLRNSGFDVIVVWVRSSPALGRLGWPEALQHLITSAQTASRDSASQGRYWMIQSNGEIRSPGNGENADLTFVPPANRTRDARGCYQRLSE